MAEKKQRRWVRVVLGVAGVVALAIIACVMVVQSRHRVTIGRDTTYLSGPLLPDGTVDYVTALETERSAGVTPENNAAVLLVKALGDQIIAEKVRAETLRRMGAEGFDPGRPVLGPDKDIEDVRQMLSDRVPLAKFREKDGVFEANRVPLRLLVEASRRPHHWFPSVLPPDKHVVIFMLLPGLGKMRAGVSMLCARALAEASAGDITAASEDLAAVHRLARLLTGTPVLIEHLVALAMETLAAQTAQRIATEAALTPAQARALLAEEVGALPLPPMTAAFRGGRLDLLDAITAIMTERLGAGSMASLLGTGPMVSPRLMILADTDTILREVNHWFDRYDKALAEPTYAARVSAMAATEADFTKSVTPVLSVGAVLSGRVMISMLFPSLNKSVVVDEQARMQSALSVVAAALAAYRSEHGAYPDTLAELAPAYLPAVPEDGFIDKPLHFARTAEGYLLYAVGPDMKDNGGTPQPKGGGGEWDMVVTTGAAATEAK